MKDLLQAAITAQADRHPDAVAISLRHERLTYAELEEMSNRLARLLKGAGCERGDRVCLLIPKSPALVVAMLGVLKADAVYVPLDLASPPSRVAKMIHACEDRWILAAEPAAPLLDALFADPGFAATHVVGWLSTRRPDGQGFARSFSWSDLAAYPRTPPHSENGPDDVAHILFTSGSTGVPKGVMITHRNVLAFLRWARAYFGTSPFDRISWHPPAHFDLSTFDVFGALSAGARLYPIPPGLSLVPHQLAEFIRGERLTQWFSVPSALNYMAQFDVVREPDFPELRRVLWCGEVLPTPTLIYWMKRLPHVAFTNLYGPTEATIASSYYTVPACPTDERAEVPIGRPCPGEELLVLNDGLQPAACGDVGDLHIGGVGLSPGYWRDPAKTRAAFVPDPRGSRPGARIYKTGDRAKVGPDGLVYYVGRADTQIKSRGFRIELGEIETALHALGCLHECAVVAIPSDGFEGMSICCAFVPGVAGGVTPTRLRERLATLVPNYMLPSRWLELDLLPKNANGKIDRPRLTEAFLAAVTTDGSAVVG